MLVDDDRTITSLLQTLLELDGYTVTTVPRGDLVIPKALEFQPDVIVMDVHIGDADGLDVLRSLRQHADLQSLPVIMSSGMDLEDQCKAAGATAFILKPYPPDQLSEAIQKVLS
jgi:CheY-like chemotaxis protein